MDAEHLPSIIGTCPCCVTPLYASAPVGELAPGVPCHVACGVHARLDRSVYLTDTPAQRSIER